MSLYWFPAQQQTSTLWLFLCDLVKNLMKLFFSIKARERGRELVKTSVVQQKFDRRCL